MCGNLVSFKTPSTTTSSSLSPVLPPPAEAFLDTESAALVNLGASACTISTSSYIVARSLFGLADDGDVCPSFFTRAFFETLETSAV
ncbi:unnamed protein product [Pseudo-nitzschia multistriata]|uniref:Uncharacterized protein n=1 Tax=Pseudo-nitzschia multistriata TaxID=183589 RepID=A0A448ZHL3_9STRA|nr:unnamed protein product [Pseudo-nitzschia multistriata]